jgi:hypothetical protein
MVKVREAEYWEKQSRATLDKELARYNKRYKELDALIRKGRADKNARTQREEVFMELKKIQSATWNKPSTE